jgi:glycosyltransferase involved in cell wall biosynthesis
MKCTVLLPVYKGGRDLQAAIESILTQDDPDFEFLIIDDCSPDGSAEMIRRYAAADSRIRAIFHDRNLGLAATLNEGLAEAGSELVARMDQDDEALPNRLSTQIRFLQSRPDVAVAGAFVYHMGRTPAFDRLVKLPVEHQEIVETLPKENCFYHPSVMLRKGPILSLGGYRAEYKNSEDYDLWLRTAKHYQLANIPVPLLRYRFSTGGMTLGKKWQQILFTRMALISSLHPEWSPERVRSEAAVQVEKMGKDGFLEDVARGTIEELLRLDLRGDAIQVLWLFSRQMSRVQASRLVMEFGLAFLSHWITPRSSPTA